MNVDPRTPVLVGVGQVHTASDAGLPAAERPEPLDLMVAALRTAAEDCDGAAPGASAPAGHALVRRADSLRVVASLGWHPPNPPLAVAGRLGREGDDEPAELLLTTAGGNSPQALVHDACRAISRGARDIVLITGAEAMYARTLAQRDPAKPWLAWADQPEGTPDPTLFGTDRAPATDLEMRRGVLLPAHTYPLFENALRAARGWSLGEHAERIGTLWARFSQVAAGNPHAWIRTARPADEIVRAGPANRMVSFPYPKLCVANMQVDQGAALIVCSAEAAREAGVPEERWVFPLAGADAHDHWFVSERPELHRSPAIRLAGAAALELAGLGVDDIAWIDLYSCFPVVVQMAAAELGLSLDDPQRPLTLTGGLTFGGGPGNNYTSHGIAQAVGALRAAPGTTALVSGLGWYATKHAIGVYASRPPAHGGAEPFAWRDVQAEVDALPRCDVDPEATGPVRVETYTVTFDRDGRPERGIVVCRTPSGSRAWANVHRRRHAGLAVRRGGHRAHRHPGRGWHRRSRGLSDRATASTGTKGGAGLGLAPWLHPPLHPSLRSGRRDGDGTSPLRRGRARSGWCCWPLPWRPPCSPSSDWGSRPRPRPSPSRVAPAAVSSLTASGGWQGATGSLAGSVGVTNTGSRTCALQGEATLTVARSGRPRAGGPPHPGGRPVATATATPAAPGGARPPPAAWGGHRVPVVQLVRPGARRRGGHPHPPGRRAPSRASDQRPGGIRRGAPM